MFDPTTYVKLVSDGHTLRQMKLMRPDQLSKFSRRRGVTIWEKHTELLWQIGLLRADMILSPEPITHLGLIKLGDHSDQQVFTDLRPIPHIAEGWTNTLSNQNAFPDGIEPLFHPFRYFVLYQLERIFSLNITPTQILHAERYPSMVEREIEDFKTWSTSEVFVERLTYWNDLATLAIVTEPCAYEVVFKRFSRPTHIEESEFRAMLNDYCISLGEFYQGLDAEQVHQYRLDLCSNAEMLDDNPGIHSLIRLGSGEMRLKLRGKLGGAMLIKAMAEIVRRAFESFHNIELPEEDELGFGTWPSGAKERLYGSSRIFDGDRAVSLQVVRQSLLDYSTRLRWYVEGSTESGAIQSIVQQYPAGIEVINLRGQFVERGGRGLAFRDSLREDLRTSVFSFITLDGDQEDIIRLVRNAARDDDFCGRFFIHDPDFEFANFALDELEEIIWGIAEENGASSENRERLNSAINNIASGEDLIRAAKNSLTELSQLSKGVSWGERLGEHAWKSREWPDGSVRSFVEQINQALRADFYDFQLTRDRYRVDPETGDLVERG